MRIEKKKILIIIVCIIIFVIILATIVNKSKKKTQTLDAPTRPASEINAEVNKQEKDVVSNDLTENLEEAKSSLKEFFNTIGTDMIYLDAYVSDSNFKVDYGSMEYIEEYAHNSLDESIDFYDADGNKIDVENRLYNENEEGVNETKGTVSGLTIPKDGENQIEISDDLNDFKVGNYYLIKYYVPFSNYTYYFISRLSTTGFKDFNLYVISSYESYRDYGAYMVDLSDAENIDLVDEDL